MTEPRSKGGRSRGPHHLALHVAASLDGKIARPDGSVDDWLAAEYPAEDFGFDAFFAGVDAILMGRATYDAVRRRGDWPCLGKPTTVVTARPVPDPPPGVEAGSGDMAGVAAEFEGRGYRRVWIEGGGRVIRSMIAIGSSTCSNRPWPRPSWAGACRPFPQGTDGLALRLVKREAKAKGALHLAYERAA